jgi:sorbitol-specific phosphotransferase system component IIC
MAGDRVQQPNACVRSRHVERRGAAMSTDPYPPNEVLNTLLAVQALLIAASTLAATIGSRAPEKPKPKDFVPQRAAAVVAGLMIAVSVGGAAAWFDVYVSNANGIKNVGDVLQAIALLAPLIVVPIFGLKAVQWAKPA